MVMVMVECPIHCWTAESERPSWPVAKRTCAASRATGSPEVPPACMRPTVARVAGLSAAQSRLPCRRPACPAGTSFFSAVAAGGETRRLISSRSAASAASFVFSVGVPLMRTFCPLGSEDLPSAPSRPRHLFAVPYPTTSRNSAITRISPSSRRRCMGLKSGLSDRSSISFAPPSLPTLATCHRLRV